MIKQAHAQMLWNTVEDATTITWLKIVDIENDHGHEAEHAREESSSSAGADTAGWLTDPHPMNQPLGLFAQLFLDYGFVDKDAQNSALEEFANVQEWEWARSMLAAIKYLESE